MAAESSRVKRDYLKYNFRANIRSPMLFVKQFSLPSAIWRKTHSLPSVFSELGRGRQVLDSLPFLCDDSITFDMPRRNP
jgi:hypothetical protein